MILLFTPPVRQGEAPARLHQGIRPRGPRERRPVHPRGDLAGRWPPRSRDGAGARSSSSGSSTRSIHATDPESVARYKVEPYVVAADIYGRAPHTGRGGWTWYTGSASWLYRVGVESILGFHLKGDHLAIDPRIPGDWPGFEVAYRHHSTAYRVVVENPEGSEHGVRSATLDGQAVDPAAIPLVDDGGDHEIRVVLGVPGA